MKRASSAQDKIKRRAAIVETATALFRDHDYASVTMAQIARGAGLAKGTVYLYFSSKEELFLSLVSDLLDGWFEDLEAELERQAPSSPEHLARIIADTLAPRQAMNRLMVLLHVVLEHNIPQEAALAFKTELLASMVPVGERLEAHLPPGQADQGMRLLLWVHALVVGLFQMAVPSDAVADALERPELAPFKLDFHHELITILTALLRGMADDGARASW